jgi:hypothetical protein
MADTIIDATQFNAQDIKYSPPKANAQQGKSVNIKTDNGALRLNTPLMLTWGASDYVDPSTGKGNGKFEMSLQFPTDEYKSEETSAFLENMLALENKIKADALVNSKEWFGKVHKNSEVVDALWTPMMKYSKNKMTGEPDLSKAPVLRIKIPIWEGVWKVEIYDEDDNRLFPNPDNSTVTPVDFIQKGTNLAVLMQCGGLWFANGKFGITWKLIQAVVQRPKSSLTGSCFIKLKPSEKAKLKAQPEVEADADVDVVQSTVVEDSDEEEEEQAPIKEPVKEPEPEPLQEEPKKKKVVKKKVTTDA